MKRSNSDTAFSRNSYVKRRKKVSISPTKAETTTTTSTSSESETLVSALLNQIVENAVERSESRESWSNIISTARPYNSNLNLEHQDYSDHYNTMSSEAEDNMAEAVFEARNNQDRKLCHVPYSFKYDFFQDDGDTTTTNSDAMSEMSDIESVISTSSSTALAAAAANRKRKSGGSGSNSAFSRNSYAKRRRKKIKQTQHLQQQQQTKPKSKLALTRQDSTKSSKASEASESEDQNIIKSDIELNISTASDSKSEAIDLGKGKRKRFQNVRMLPIEEVCRSPPRKK